MLFNILASISVLLAITFLRKLVALFPSLFACMLRWKENVNMESSMKLSYDRNVLAVILIIPFCLTVERYRLYEPPFIENMDENLRIGVTFGVFFAYFLIRSIASGIALAYTEKKKAYSPAVKSAYTFFIMLTLTLLVMGGVLSFFHVGAYVIRNAMLWVSVFIYALCLLRKFQIFASGFSILTCFLYLCALEIIPTGLLVASALIF